ncbi:polysaccharide deacetylase family protein [Salegentibacter flavus]|uniref:Polysaccharide deacetylase n=1 Tax=Salegentibacter flavus TaxID=287099 RepID=A0A1I4Y4G6_9FLAO|nr:polysaccharide deacetylase family protein [Salegentibacter flavus]SFN32981.1 Polysaccharide deacetylase [Salegentibacter flavus]
MLIISNYHYIRENFSAPFPSIFGLSPVQFRRQMEELSKFGEFISLKDLHHYRENPLNKNYFLITFDDGLKEQYELAKPVVDSMGISAVYFINTSNFTEKKVSLVHKIHLLRSRVAPEEILQMITEFANVELNQEEIDAAVKHYNYDSSQNARLKYLLNFKLSTIEQENIINPLFQQVFDEKKVATELYFSEKMLTNLWEEGSLASHSHSHLPLGKLSQAEVEQELRQTQDFFKSEFGKPAKAISYPYGSYEACKNIRESASNSGFDLGFSMERAGNISLQEDSLLLGRYDCNDLPGGKNNLFGNKNPFETAATRKWHTYANSITNKQ